MWFPNWVGVKAPIIRVKERDFQSMFYKHLFLLGMNTITVLRHIDKKIFASVNNLVFSLS